jgi:metal-responsive CopG/Arc/MetJ family transcriptional regulator
LIRPVFTRCFQIRAAASAIREYNYFVKVKTSITLPAELLVRLDRVDKNRSAVLERAALAYLSLLEQQARDRKDIAIIERNAKRLNREAQDTLEYQRTP